MTEGSTMDFIPRRRYLSEEAARLIKDRIIKLKYPPGSRLVVETLAQQIKVSMTPVREGLKELVAQGLIVYDGKSYSVFNPTEKDIVDLFIIRRYLEQLSAYESAQFMSDEALDVLIKYYEEYKQKNGFSDFSDLIKMDMKFHRDILAGTNNSRLQNMLESIHEQCWLIRAWGFANTYTKEYAEKTVQEHLDVLYSIKSRDAKVAEMAMRDHLISGEERTFFTLNSTKNHKYLFKN